uniref:histone-lysine N-methyltransferase SUV39H2-like n=1 Tax=Styela clava TaxID=7725 RepID=UPI00193950FF|nr:histone-lysine N-methyltransferase SUV39H2-like [Styela clava]
MEYDSEGITYLFDLDYHETDNPMTVDATRFGNVSHFINHSCAPNLQVYNVFINNMDLSLPRIALFARKNINVNEELSFDYQMTGASEDMQDQASEEISDRQSEVSDTSKTSSILKKKCLCKASNCRGWLVM